MRAKQEEQQERDRTRAELDGIKQERDSTRAELDDIKQKRDSTRAELDGIKQECMKVKIDSSSSSSTTVGSMPVGV